MNAKIKSNIKIKRILNNEKKNCPKCFSNRIKLYGKNKNRRQRFKCLNCNRVFVWKVNRIKKIKERHWFKLWIKEGYSIRQLSKISKYSQRKIAYIIKYWLQEKPKEQKIDYKDIKYILFDGTYFNRTNCLIVFMDAISGKIIARKYVDKENYIEVNKLAEELKAKGLNPKSVTLDGLNLVIKAIKDTWNDIIIQRCLYHIFRQGTMWLRFKPKSEIAKQLKIIYANIKFIKNINEATVFINEFDKFIFTNINEINKLSSKDKVEQDIQRAISLIHHARNNMFHFFNDHNIPDTTNKIEGFFSKLKKRYRGHAGLSKSNRESYLNWFCYYENNKK